MGPGSVTFLFSCQKADASVTPVIVKPDGTICHGLPMTSLDSPQALEMSSPAQTGIYTLFVLAQQKNAFSSHVTVNATISTQPQDHQIFHLKPFDSGDQDAELISAEFIYTP